MQINSMLIILDIIIPLIILINPLKHKIKNKQKMREFIILNKYELVMYLILVIGCLVRNVAIDKYPMGFEGDGASAGYEAYSIYKYGIDRHIKSYPIYLISWGSGQNALYSYIAIPFIANLGLSIFSTRLPMSIIGCITLFIVYYASKNLEDKKTRLVALFIFAICPWHIMKSRWALESNLFPDIFFIGFLLLLTGLKKEKIKYFYLGSIIIRDFCIFIWYIIFFYILFYDNFINNFITNKENKIKKCINIFNNNRNNCYTYNIIHRHKYI